VHCAARRSFSHTVCAFTVTIAPAAPKTVYLQWSRWLHRQLQRRRYACNNATVNKDSVTVAAAAVATAPHRP